VEGHGQGRITIKNVLQMEWASSGNEEYNPDSARSFRRGPDGLERRRLAYPAARPVATAPGKRWLYSSGDAMLISEVIAKATGMSAAE